MKKYFKWTVLLSLVVAFTGCSDDDSVLPEINNISGIESYYSVDRCKVLTITPVIEGFENGSFSWVVSNAALNISDSIVGDSPELIFIMLEHGIYDLVLIAKKDNEEKIIETKVVVKKENSVYSPYITEVFDYLPAVGQFVNALPAYEDNDSQEIMRQKAEEALIGKNSSMIHLGGFGGYVTFGFDHTIVNVPNVRDFRVKGNAFWSASNPNAEVPARGGSCEPGIIMVAYDKNKNGKPDENEWYEIAGSEYNNPKTKKKYQITYYKPESEPAGADSAYIKWDDNLGNSGYKVKNSFHKQSYYPLWIQNDKIAFTGTLLPNNAIDESGKGTYWVLYSYAWGYADNAPNDDDASAIDIDWAVDSNGNKVNLPGIDFIKVYTGVNQEAGWLGETSTEVAGAEDLHLLGLSIASK